MITVCSRGQQYGPYSLQDVQRFIREGNFSPDDLGWEPGLSEWKHLREFTSAADVQNVSPGWAGHRAVPPKPKFDTGAIWSLVFGLLSLTFCLFGLTSIFAIVMGVNAKKRISAVPREHDRRIRSSNEAGRMQNLRKGV